MDYEEYSTILKKMEKNKCKNKFDILLFISYFKKTIKNRYEK